MAPKHVVVTGGAGFIGSHLAELLLDVGAYVTVIDNFSTGRPGNLEGLSGRLRLVEADLSGDVDLAAVFAGADSVFHLAALADIVPSIEYPHAYHQANVTGTFRALAGAAAAGVRRFIYAASSSCYGLTEEFPTTERAPIDPRYPYALTKWVGEQYVLHWAKVYGLQALSLRLFNVYGPRSRTSGTYGAVFGVFLAQRLSGSPLTIVGDGTQTRDFVYVTDVAEAFRLAGESTLNGEVINIGTGRPQSVNRLAALIGGETIHIPKRPGEPDRTQADITKARQLLLWEPRVPFEEGVAHVLANIEYWRDAPVWTPESIAAATRSWHMRLSAS